VVDTVEDSVRGLRELRQAAVLPQLVQHLRLYSCFRRRSYELLRSLTGRAIVWGKDNEVPDAVLSECIGPSVVEAFKLAPGEERALRLLNGQNVAEAVRVTEELFGGSVPRPWLGLGDLLEGEWTPGRVLEVIRRRLGRRTAHLSGF
jgi:hypothetical protein